MVKAFVVFFSGGLGSVCRYLMTLHISKFVGVPGSILIVNVSGGFVAGVVACKFPHLKLFLLIGFLGGFTTFSAFSLECVSMIQNQQFFFVTLYIILSVLLSVLSAWVGLSIFN
ncbi:MAG: fluoride efflux transporter FluC [Pseudomonadota bacterium]|jgi:CrcB protein|nr:CrcB family protein [Alphaproteobacteria bacterium]